MTWSSRFRLLSRTYGFTPEQIRNLTLHQASEYMLGVIVEKNDPALVYEEIDRNDPAEIRFRERLKRKRQEVRELAEKRKKDGDKSRRSLSRVKRSKRKT